MACNTSDHTKESADDTLSVEGWLVSAKGPHLDGHFPSSICLRAPGLLRHTSLDCSGSEDSTNCTRKRKRQDQTPKGSDQASVTEEFTSCGDAVREARKDPVWSSELLLRPDSEVKAHERVDLMRKSTYIVDLFIHYCLQRGQPVAFKLDRSDEGCLRGSYQLACSLKLREESLDYHDTYSNAHLQLVNDVEREYTYRCLDDDDDSDCF